MENINYHTFLNMCRTCMLDIDLKPIEDKTIIEILEFITEKNFKTNDELPQQICGTCIKKLLEINNFITQTKQSDNKLKEYLTNLKNECPSVTIEPGNSKPLQVYVFKPEKIKEEKPEDTPNAESINFDSIIKDMRKEFDVLPTSDPLNITSIKSEVTAGEQTNVSISTDDDSSTDDSSKQAPETTATNRCDVCDKKFATRSSLKRHMRLHSQDNPFKCDKCQKIFSESSHLIKHKRIHLGIKPYECDACDKRFTEIGQLNRHKRTHSGAKPYRCDVCDKVFGNSSGLVKHKRIHTGLKPYKCDVCTKVFRTSSHLMSHRIVHADKRDFKCDVCLKLFKSEVHLRKHAKMHVAGKSRACDVCAKIFRTDLGLELHKNAMHLDK